MEPVKETKHNKRKVAEWKKKRVAEAVQEIKKYSIVGLANLEKIPAAQLQRMMKGMRGKVNMFMAKKRLLKLAFEELEKDKGGIKGLGNRFKGIPALILTEENPFLLYKTLQKSKSKAPAKIGDELPSDVVIPAGPTQFAPGPIISELGSVGIKTSVKDGKLVVMKDTTIAKAGDKVNAKIANVLAKFSILPMEIGLDLVCAYENGTLFGKDVLAVDEDKFKSDLENQARICYNLCIELGVINSLTIKPLIMKAFRDSKAIALEAAITADAIVSDLIAKAESQARSVKSNIDKK